MVTFFRLVLNGKPQATFLLMFGAHMDTLINTTLKVIVLIKSSYTTPTNYGDR
jgi:hypothetical protein